MHQITSANRNQCRKFQECHRNQSNLFFCLLLRQEADKHWHNPGFYLQFTASTALSRLFIWAHALMFYIWWIDKCVCVLVAMNHSIHKWTSVARQMLLLGGQMRRNFTLWVIHSQTMKLIRRNEDWLHYTLPVHYTSHRNIDLSLQTTRNGALWTSTVTFSAAGLMRFINCLSAFHSGNLALFLI